MVREKEQLPFGGHHIQFFFVLWGTSHPVFLCPLEDITSKFSLSFGGHHIQFFFVLHLKDIAPAYFVFWVIPCCF